MADIPDWLTEFTDNLVEDLHAPTHSSPKTDLGLPVEVAMKSRKHGIHTHFPKDRNYDGCLKNRITRVPCRRRTVEALLPAQNFGDMITSDHKVLNEGCESRNNQRYAVVVQDLATHWIQSYPCETKSSHETERSLSKFLEPSHRPKVEHTQTSRWNLGQRVKFYHGITALQHLIDPRRMASLKEPSDE